MPESSNKGGRKPRVTDEDLLDVFRSTSDPVLSTAEVAEQVPIKRRGTLNRLQGLEEDGVLESKQIGGRNTVWWLLEERDVSDTEDRRPEIDDPAPVDEVLEEPEGDVAPLEDTVDTVAEDVLPGSGAKLEARRDALHAAVDYLREQGEATPSDFQTNVYPEYNGEYTAGEDPAYSWWTNCIYKGLRELAERTDTVEKADTTGTWAWRGEASA